MAIVRDDLRVGTWDIWMLGVSYFNEGLIHEKGGYYTRPNEKARQESKDYNGFGKNETEVIVLSERIDGANIRYRFNGRTRPDPILKWYGIESQEGRVDKLRFFQTSRMFRRLAVGLNRGVDFDYDKAWQIDHWLARSHYGRPDEWSEVYFNVLSPEMLEGVALYYNLPVPCTADMLAELQDATKYRTRHYKLGLKDKEKELTPVTTASVVFTNGNPRRLILYTFMRPWEFDEMPELPDF